MILSSVAHWGHEAKHKLPNKNFSHWRQYCTLGGCTLGATGVLFIREYAVNSLSFSRLYFEFIIFFAKILWIHFLFCEYTLNPWSFFKTSLWIHYLFREFRMKSLFFAKIYFEFMIFHYEFIIVFANSLWIQYLFSEFTLNSLFFSRIDFESIIFSRLYYDFIIFFANPLWRGSPCRLWTIKIHGLKEWKSRF